MTFAQPIVIVQDGPGICPGGKITLSTNDPALTDYKWEVFRSSGWSAVPFENNARLSTAEPGRYHLLGRDISGFARISNELNLIALPSGITTY